MKYIKPFIIEIFTALLFQDKPIEIEKDYWWEEGDNIDENGEEHKPEPMLFFPEFEQYVSESNLQDVIIITDNYDNNVITLKNTLQAKNKLKKFLQNYMNIYRRGELEPYAHINYFSYQENLSYMKNVLYELSDSFRQKEIVLHSYRFRREKTTHYAYPLANERIKLAEFLLDIYFHFNKKLIKINSCEIKYGGFHTLGTAALIIYIKLLEHPDIIYKELAKQLTFEKPELPTKISEKMYLEFSCKLEKEKYSKGAHIILSGRKINLPKTEYRVAYAIAINKLKELRLETKDIKGKKYLVNDKVQKALKDKDFELFIHDGSCYSLNKEKVILVN
jgi:hypothetical protein